MSNKKMAINEIIYPFLRLKDIFLLNNDIENFHIVLRKLILFSIIVIQLIICWHIVIRTNFSLWNTLLLKRNKGLSDPLVSSKSFYVIFYNVVWTSHIVYYLYISTFFAAGEYNPLAEQYPKRQFSGYNFQSVSIDQYWK